MRPKFFELNKIYILLVSFLICTKTFSQNGLANVNGSFGDFGQYSMHPLTSGYSINSFNTIDNTRGRRYLFDEWVRGSVVNKAGKLINSEEYYFNFDKVNNNLLVTKDKKEIIEVNKESIKEIQLLEKDVEYDLVKEEKITPFRFVEILVKNENVSVYKTINTRLVKANFTTNGLTESGNPYDEYVDAPTYFIGYKGEFRPVSLKFSSMKKSLPEESKKVKQFYADHLNDEVDEVYLKNLVIFLNQ